MCGRCLPLLLCLSHAHTHAGARSHAHSSHGATFSTPVGFRPCLILSLAARCLACVSNLSPTLLRRYLSFGFPYSCPESEHLSLTSPCHFSRLLFCLLSRQYPKCHIWRSPINTPSKQNKGSSYKNIAPEPESVFTS